MDERRGQRERPAGRIGQPVAAGQLAHPLADLERDERRQERHEDGDTCVPGQGPRGEDQDRQADRVERVDRPALPPHPEVRRERRVVEDGVAALGVVALEREVPVAEEALGDHEVVRLVSLRPDPRVRPAGRRDENGERQRQEEGPGQPQPRARDRDRGARQRQREKGRPGESPHARKRRPRQEEPDGEQEAGARRERSSSMEGQGQHDRDGEDPGGRRPSRHALPGPPGTGRGATRGQQRRDRDPAGAEHGGDGFSGGHRRNRPILIGAATQVHPGCPLPVSPGDARRGQGLGALHCASGTYGRPGTVRCLL